MSAERPPVCTILLIGSTGHGKSTLGNFLLDPSDRHIIKDQTFQIASGIAPETQLVKTATKKDLRVIDTPGLNESATKDLEHMIEIVKTLKDNESGAISACILCIRFESKLDAQHKATTAYYRKLLPGLFEGNVLIVLTNFQDDRRAQRDREIRNIHVNDVVKDTVREVVEVGNLAYWPQVFMIDSLPLDAEDRETSERARLAILSYINESIEPVRVRDLKVAKTDALKQIDAEEIEGLDGEISGYRDRLVEKKEAGRAALSQIVRKEREKSDFEFIVMRHEAELEDKDSTEKVTSAEWSLKHKWKIGRILSEKFNIPSQWPVVDYKKWDNGKLTWTDFTMSQKGASGKVEGRFMRGLYANVTLKTEKRYKYADEIRSLREKIERFRSEVVRVNDELEQYRHECGEFAEDIRLLQEHIKEKTKRKKALSTDYLWVEEAANRLKDL